MNMQKPRLLSSVLAGVAMLTSAALAQSGDGYIGIYADSVGTAPCASVPPMTAATLYVVAKTAGASAGGVAGAEFRIEVTSPTGWFISYAPPFGANVVLGNPIDTDPDPNAGGGANVSFPSCKTPEADGRIAFGTLSIFNQSGGSTKLLVKRHSAPANSGFRCALFVKCDSPAYTKVCMTSAPPDSCTLGTLKGAVAAVDDPAIFTASLNEGGAEPPRPAFSDHSVLVAFVPGAVALAPGRTWGTLAEVSVSSPALETVLASHNVESIAEAFPDYAPSDADGVAWTGEHVRLTDFTNFYYVSVPTPEDPAQLAADLRGLDVVGSAALRGHFATSPGSSSALHAESDKAGGSLPVPSYCVNDTYFGQQWALNGPNGIRACEAWGTTAGDPGTKIGFVLHVIDAMHEDLIGKIYAQNTEPPGLDPTAHPEATSLAGIAAALTNNSLGMAGVDPEAQVIAQTLACDCDDDPVAVAADAIRATANLGARIVDFPTLFKHNGVPTYAQPIRLALRDIYMQNRVVITIVGNKKFSDDPPFVAWPAASGSGMLVVGASTPGGAKWPYSNSAPYIDVVAPGQQILAPVPTGVYGPIGGKYWAYSGTDAASACVAGVAGLLHTAGNELLRTVLYNDDIEQLIRLSATDVLPVAGFDEDTGMGLVNAEAALDLLKFPYALKQLYATGVSRESLQTPEWMNQFVWVPPAPHAPNYYLVRRWEVQKDVTFPSFQSTPHVWGRGVGMVGWEYYTAGDNFGLGWCEPVEGTVTPSGCTLRTFVYEIRDYQYGTPLGWWPCHYNSVQWAYTAHGTVTTSEAGSGEAETGAPRLVVSSPNPIREGHRVWLALPKAVATNVEVFDIAGRRVRVLRRAEMGAGRHEIEWDGLDEEGQRLPSGLYFIRVTTPVGMASRRVVVIG